MKKVTELEESIIRDIGHVFGYYEPRSYDGKLFPTVDILEEYQGNRAVYASFGLDPFTYGNLREVFP